MKDQANKLLVQKILSQNDEIDEFVLSSRDSKGSGRSRRTRDSRISRGRSNQRKSLFNLQASSNEFEMRGENKVRETNILSKNLSGLIYRRSNGRTGSNRKTVKQYPPPFNK